jgi:GAF domain-containing protein
MRREDGLLWRLRRRWEKLLTLDDASPERGFLGSVPHLLVLRYLFFFAVFLRLWLHRHEYSASGLTTRLIVGGLIGVLVLAATYATFKPAMRRSRLTQRAMIASDIALITAAYALTNNPESDFFLFYYLPIFAAAEHLRDKEVTGVFALVTIAFGGMLVFQHPSENRALTATGLVWRVFIPREIFFAAIVVPSAFVFQRLSRRESEVRTLLKFKLRVDRLFEEKQIFGATVKTALAILGADWGYLVVWDRLTGKTLLSVCAPEDCLDSEDRLHLSMTTAEMVQKSERRALRLKGIRQDLLPKGFVTRSLMMVPLVSYDTVLGSVLMGSSAQEAFDASKERLLQALVELAAASSERARLLRELYSVGAFTPSALALDMNLEQILLELTQNLGFEFATVSLVDEYRNCIETVRGKNVPSGWLRRAKHSLDHRDIQADIVRTGKTEVISGWDDRFDEEIYKRFRHSERARVFAPLIAGGKVVGTIEAGCSRARQSEVITPSTIERVSELGRETGGFIAISRPHIVVKKIAEAAIAILGGDSACVYVYKAGASTSTKGERELLLASGAGLVNEEFVRTYQPDDTGDRLESEEVILDDPREFAGRCPGLWSKGVRARAAFPLSLGCEAIGVLYIDLWSEGRRFTSVQLELARIFVHQMENSIQNNLLVRNMTVIAEEESTVTSLLAGIQSLASGFDLSQLLEAIAQSTVDILDAESVVLYQYHSKEKAFDAPVTRGHFVSEPAPLTPPHYVVWPLVEAGTSLFVTDVSNDPVLSQSGFVKRNGIRSCAVMALKTPEPSEIVGLMFINYTAQQDFTLHQKDVVYTLASYAALAINTARLLDRVRGDLDRRGKELEAMHAVEGAIVNGACELREVLELTLQRALAITGAQFGEFMLVNSVDGTLESGGRSGIPKDRPSIRQRIGEGIIGLSAESKQSVLVGDVKSGQWANLYKVVDPDTRSELAVPLLEPTRGEAKVLGVLNIESHKVNAFSEDDKILLQLLAVPAIIAIHSVDLYNRVQRRNRHLESLNRIAARVAAKPYELDTVLRLYLTGVTAGVGLGFSRAMLFLTDNGGTSLHGELAIGAVSRSEAEAVWEGLQSKGSASTSDLDLLLKQAEQTSDDLRAGRITEHPPLSSSIRQVSLLIDESAGAVAECLQRAETVAVAAGRPDPFRKVIRRFTVPDDLDQAFACVPLIGKQTRGIGVLVVDNRFLFKERTIDAEDIAGLEAFAGLLALSIENANLQKRLAHEQRAEDTAEIAHIVGTRISAMAGKVTRLRHRVRLLNLGDSVAEVKSLLNDLRSSISKAQAVLHEFRTFAASTQLNRRELDLRTAITDVYQDVVCSYPIELTLPEEPLPVAADPVKVSHALMEVIKNAFEAAAGGTGISKPITIKVDVERSPTTSQVYARLEILDTGPGIPDENKQEIFRPFFTTKTDGTGLGLAIAKSVIDAHGGSLEAHDNPGGGARFIMRIPCKQGHGLSNLGGEYGKDTSRGE